ncbi:hypothetical protein KC19_11G050400 [Ceratodon purpureus]|uniref:Uncharacterized protein n=1 Tax=Ceratodon purpureus TaxID=3225 RepID=A0A8T0GGT8_CERPU|nr:hypothetical protein KC19_11G050400 [Ceratodon purpureus]
MIWGSEWCLSLVELGLTWGGCLGKVVVKVSGCCVKCWGVGLWNFILVSIFCRELMSRMSSGVTFREELLRTDHR